MKLNRRFSKNSEITEDLDGIAVALCWNGNSESWEKIDCQAGEELRRLLLDFSGRGKKWDIWKDTQADFQKSYETLDLMTEVSNKKHYYNLLKKLTDLGVAGISGLEDFEFQKKQCEADL